MNTKQLKDNLKHCIGRSTVEFNNNTVYHFNSPILTVKDNMIILDSYYFDYSASTSRVRNKAVELLTGYQCPSTYELRQAQKNGEILSVGNFSFWFSEWVA